MLILFSLLRIFNWEDSTVKYDIHVILVWVPQGTNSEDEDLNYRLLI